MIKSKKNISRVLFDVRPVSSEGIFDFKKAEQIQETLDLRKHENNNRELPEIEYQPRQKTIEREEKIKSLEINPPENILPEIKKDIVNEPQNDDIQDLVEGLTKEEILAELNKIEALDSMLSHHPVNFVSNQEKKDIFLKSKETSFQIEQFYFPEAISYKEEKTAIEPKKKFNFEAEKLQKPILKFILTGFIISLIVPAFTFLSKGLEIKDQAIGSSLSAYQNLLRAKESLEKSDWQTAEKNFSIAHADFIKTQEEINQLGRLTVGILEKIPGTSLISSGSHLIKVGENLSESGKLLTSAINLFSFDKLFDVVQSEKKRNILASENNLSLTDKISQSQAILAQSLENIKLANDEVKEIKIDSLPSNISDQVILLSKQLPLVEEMISGVLNYSKSFLKILGHDNPRQYLLIFQNNSEIRATGGFIGTYGLVTLDRGEMKDLFIDGIFNADGQLHEKIIPPRPIQKISTAWSTHDSNWFADFPTSARKISWFYEKTGGPTVDGVISITPTLIEELLDLTGPIEMPEYDLVLNSSNFVELIQYKVEIDYDKELNRPKKILADFTPLFINKIESLSSDQKKKAIEIIFKSLQEKHFMAYFEDPSLEKFAVEEGWAGELKQTEKDYLSVVSSNINGFKTDRVISEKIDLLSEIQSDGSIVNTLTITREHRGGSNSYDWWNQVNANYLRVYLPNGSQLVSASGHARELYQPPIDYQEQGFKKDAQVSQIENNMKIDQKTGTHIFEESDKTVFGNWVYVSPGETVVVEYKYVLPFKIVLTKSSDSYSILIQKQSGSIGSKFNYQLSFPSNWHASWFYPENMVISGGKLTTDLILNEDRFIGSTFQF